MSSYKKIIKLKASNEELVGIKVSKKDSEKPSFLFIHGGASDKYITLYLAKRLLDKGIATFAFDHSGNGESTGKISNSSLKKRFEETKEVIRLLFSKKSITLCGSSMGGYTALKLLSTQKVDNLILFCPAVYDARAFDKQFDSGFTEIIRQKESWKNSDIFSLLDKFKGNLLIFIGENDKVIPKGVIEQLDKCSSNSKKKEIVYIPGCSHKIHNWISGHQDEAEAVTQKIVNFLK